MSTQTKPIVAILASVMMSVTAPVAVAGEAAGQPSMAHVKKEVRDAAVAIKDYSAAQRDQAVAASKAALDDLDARISRQQTDVRKCGSGCFGAQPLDVGPDLPDHLRTEKPKIVFPGKIRQG